MLYRIDLPKDQCNLIIRNIFNEMPDYKKTETGRKIIFTKRNVKIPPLKKLKKKLKELEQLQQKGQYLGVPVLTRFLGDDFPAWVGEDVNEEEWKRNVEAEYVKMRKEEEEWKEQMQKIIDQRERDIGITTAR